MAWRQRTQDLMLCLKPVETRWGQFSLKPSSTFALPSEDLQDPPKPGRTSSRSPQPSSPTFRPDHPLWPPSCPLNSFLCLGRWFSTWVHVGGGVGEEIQPSRKQLEMSGDISGCHDSGQRERDLVGGGWGCCSTSYNAQGSPHRMNYLVPNIASAEAERPCPRMIAPPSGSQLTRHLLEKPFANCSLPLCPSHDTGHWFSSHRPSEL